MFDEEKDEMHRDFHRATRDRWQPDGMSAPPDCEHPKLRPIPGVLGELGTCICTVCGWVGSKLRDRT